MEQAQPRKTYLDLLRMIACFGIIFCRVALRDMRMMEGVSGAAVLFGYFLCKSAAPLLLMTSGAVLLGRVDPWRVTAARVLRTALALTLFSLLYDATDCLAGGEAFALSAFGARLLRGEVSLSYWYLYLYIGVLIALPLMQRLERRMTVQDFRYFVLWALLYSGAVTVLLIRWPELRVNQGVELALFAVPLGLLLFGRAADRWIGRKGGGILLAAAAIPLLAAIPAALVVRDGTLFNLLDYYGLPTATGVAGIVFLLVKRLEARLQKSERAQSAIAAVGKLTFCTYLVSDLLVERMQFLREALVPSLRVNGAGLVYALIVFFAGLAVSAVLGRIPGLKTLLAPD